MGAWREWLRRLGGSLRRNPREREMEEELRLHLELAEAEGRRRGDAPENARRAARLQAGGVAQAMEAMRDQRGLRWLDDLIRDVRHALRSLRRTPVFTAVALLTLALGIGANTAIFSIVNGVVLQPLPYPQPEQLMHLDTQVPDLGLSQHPVSPPEYFEFRELNQSFADVGAFILGYVNLAGDDRALRVRSATVDGHLLGALGVQPVQGRLFARGETDVSGPWNPGDPGNGQPPAIVILSHELWQTAFGGHPIVGESIEVDGQLREVIGVMPPGADLMDRRIEVWLPLGLNPSNRQWRGYHILSLVGRLKDDITVQAAQTEVNALMESWGRLVGLGPEDGIFIPLDQPSAHVLQMRPLQDVIVGDARRSIWVLQAAVGLVLLIACANLANLLLARAETRRHEFALRAALGAGRGRMLRQLMTEAMLLSLAGGALGVWLAWGGVAMLVRAYPTSLPRVGEVTVDLPVLLFSLGVSLGAGLLFGLAPIACTRMKTLATALTEGGTRGAIGWTRHRLRAGLVVAEVTLAVVLVIGAGLLLRTVYNLTHVDAGFDRSRLVTVSIMTPDSRYPHAARGQMYQRLLDALRAVPGVRAVTATSGLPPVRPYDGEGTYIDNYIAGDGTPGANIDHYQSVMSGYFETMGIPIVQGRGFQPADAASSGMVAVVNEAFANRFWPGLNPVGQRLRPAWGDWVPWFTVVGVARDVKQRGLDQPAGTDFYFFVDQMANAPSPLGRAPAAIDIVLRTTLPLSSLAATIEGLVHEMDPAVPVVSLREMDAVFAESIRRPRLLAGLIGAFAGLALLLAAMGVYGVLSYLVVQRRREIGIRIALGATRGSVLAAVLKRGLQFTAVGVGIGTAGALALNRWMASLLFGVAPNDAATFVAAIATISVAALVACWLPARRASRLDPNVMLRID